MSRDDDEHDWRVSHPSHLRRRKASATTTNKQIVESRSDGFFAEPSPAPLRQSKLRPAYEPRPSGAKDRIKDMIIDQPDISPREIKARLDDAGYTVSLITVSSIRADFRHTLQVLARRDWIKITLRR
jgi:hypothetical protein